MVKNEAKTKANKPKIPPYIIDSSGQKIYRYQYEKTTIFIKYKTGGESIKTLLQRHIEGVMNAEK